MYENNGEVRYNYTNAKQVLELFGELARGKTEALLSLCDEFDRETENGKDMQKYDDLLLATVSAISKTFDQQEIGILDKRDGILAKQSDNPCKTDDFELVTWLVIKNSM